MPCQAIWGSTSVDPGGGKKPGKQITALVGASRAKAGQGDSPGWVSGNSSGRGADPLCLVPGLGDFGRGRGSTLVWWEDWKWRGSRCGLCVQGRCK